MSAVRCTTTSVPPDVAPQPGRSRIPWTSEAWIGPRHKAGRALTRGAPTTLSGATTGEGPHPRRSARRPDRDHHPRCHSGSIAEPGVSQTFSRTCFVGAGIGNATAKRGPVVHEAAPFFHHVSAPVRCLGLVLEGMRKRGLGDLVRVIRHLRTPVAECAAEPVHGQIRPAQGAQQVRHGILGQGNPRLAAWKYEFIPNSTGVAAPRRHAARPSPHPTAAPDAPARL